MAIRAVLFDIGETLVDETRQWGAWADWLKVPRLAFFASLGSIIERGEHHRRVFDLFRPGFDMGKAQQEWPAAKEAVAVRAEDFYPDAVPCLRELRELGYIVGLAGNQPGVTEDVLKRLNLPVDLVASSERLGVEKPSQEFFSRIAQMVHLPPREIAHVGDRLDNDVLPALQAGMVSIFLRRGPWGFIHARSPEVRRAHLHLDSLVNLPKALRDL